MPEDPAHKPSRGRGRPRTSDGPVVTREELLAIAARSIGKQGFDATSIRFIATEAGVSMRTVQNHFPAKDDLWRALVDEVIAPRFGKKVSEDASDVPPTIAGEIGQRIEAAVERPGLSAAVLTDTSAGARERLEYLAATLADVTRQNLLTLSALMDAGVLRSMDPRSLAIAISIGLTAISSSKTAIEVLYDVDLDEAEQRDALTGDLTDLLLYGLLPRASEQENP